MLFVAQGDTTKSCARRAYVWLRNFDHYPIAKPRVNNSVLPSADE